MWHYNDITSVDYDSASLAHYGVVGMKWGNRRAQKRGEAYTYQSHATKKYARKAAKTKNAMKKEIYESRLNRSKKIDAAEQSHALGMSGGKTAAGVGLFGTGNMKTYQQHKAMGSSTAKAAALTYLGGREGAAIRKAVDIRKGDAEIRNKYKGR